MPSDVGPLQAAIAAEQAANIREAQAKVKAQVMHDLCIITAGCLNRHEFKDTGEIAKFVVDMYQTLKKEVDQRINYLRSP